MNTERELIDVLVSLGWDEYERIKLPRITKEEILTFNPRYILNQKPIGINGYDRKSNIVFIVPNIKYCGIEYPSIRMAVNVGDFIDVLEGLPHIPNKKESKAIRKEKIKRGK
jgi:hypothetical protein